jgi:hypothetical protein
LTQNHAEKTFKTCVLNFPLILHLSAYFRCYRRLIVFTRIAEHYTWDKVTDGYEELFRELVVGKY